MQDRPIARVLDLVDPASQHLQGMSRQEAEQRLLAADPARIVEIPGSFALVARDGERVVLARSLDRPLRYFLAKEADGPMLVVSDRIDTIRRALVEEGYADQFHPSYSRMVPAHYFTTLRLVGCPDPNPVHTRFFTPTVGPLPADLDLIGERYVGALLDEVGAWLATVPHRAPLGVLFSGGLDSSAVLLALHHQLLARGEAPARLKAFTLAVEGDGADLAQARQIVRRTGLEMLLEPVEVPAKALDPLAAVEIIEDYKPRDVECATVALALLREIRRRYPDWEWLADGDGGDENLKDYPIEENPELTIRSVVNNPMLYQEGWGVEAIKHSLTYSGGLSRGCVRTWATARRFGFRGFSPFTRPSLVAVAAAIPFADLAGGDHDRLYALKGEILARGFRRLLDVELPVFPKRRFQDGAGPETILHERFNVAPHVYRLHFLHHHTG